MRRAIALPIAALLASVAAYAAERPTIIPPNGERAGYLWTITRHSPAGSLDASAAVTLRGTTPPGTMQVAVTVDGADQVYTARSSADGSLNFVATKHEDTVPELLRLDQVARLAGGAGATPKLGDTWRMEFSEPVPGGSIDVTVQAKVTTVDGDAFSVEAGGEALGTIAVPKPEPTPGGRGGAPGQGFPGSGPSTLNSDVDDGTKAKDNTMDVKMRVHVSASFAGGLLREAGGSQIVSPVQGPKEQIETDWALTKS